MSDDDLLIWNRCRIVTDPLQNLVVIIGFKVYPSCYESAGYRMDVIVHKSRQHHLTVQVNQLRAIADKSFRSRVVTNVDDLLAVIGAYNTTCDCPEDVNDDGVVNVEDVLEILSAYGEVC